LGFDAVLIPGGGLDHNGEPAPWVKPRLDLALAIEGEPLVAVLSAGTPHKPPLLDESRFPVFESVSAAHYLINQGCQPERILVDTWSLDTIGNAFFARVVHCEPRRLKHLLVVTSDFHMLRTHTIFEWVFTLRPCPVPFQLTFQAVRDTGMSKDALESRHQKEEEALKSLALTMKRITSMEAFHKFLFIEHNAYRAGQLPRDYAADAAWIKSY
jgi:uncharacterized SAM-binding protein YcdF (DUF218 family)